MHLILISVPLLSLIAVRVAQTDDLLCEKPLDIEHAKIVDAVAKLRKEHEIGAEIAYGCEFGYVVTGKGNTVKCQRHGNRAEWEEPQFSCTPRSCGDPGYVNNGFRVGSLFTFPNSVTYDCDVGYSLSGSVRTLYCQTNGIWSGSLPSCEIITCGPPKVIANGQVTASSYDYGSELTYTCDKGFRLSTNEASYCTEDGSWSKTDVTCKEILCEMPEKPEFGDMTFSSGEERPRAGSIVVFTCEDNRIASGPKTTKCLDIGRWTFPPPKCLVPCTIEYVDNGVIGKYERKGYFGNRYVFKEIKVGTQVEEDENLTLRCSDKYEASDSTKQETKISCSKGIWSVDLQCTLAPCRSKEPLASNVQVVNINRKHGGTVSYECLSDYKKVSEETVICEYGTWKGKPPTCQSTKCLVSSISDPGVVKKSNLYYSDGEIFNYSCASPRYNLPVGHSGQIKCVDGKWTGVSPFCTPASCTEPPPQIEHGSAKDLSMDHGAVVRYVCEHPYTLVSHYQVQCSHGEYKGKAPECVDSRCNLRDLNTLSGVSYETQSITVSGNKLNVICLDGFSERDEMPLCRNGEWTRYNQSPCKESGCVIPRDLHGSVNRQTFGNWEFDTYYFRFIKRSIYIQIPPGSVVEHGEVVHLICEDSYSIYGKGIEKGVIECIRGIWTLDPVCLRYGQTYHPTTAAPRLRPTPLGDIPITSTIPPKQFSLPSIPSLSVLEVTAPIRPESKETIAVPTDPATETPADECFCNYPLNSSYVVAHADGKKLAYGDKVQNGSKVVFRCKHVGFLHFNGRPEITCEDCGPWYSGDFPSCTEHKKGDAVVILDKEINVLIDGTAEIKKGQNVKLRCIAMETAEYPDWSVPSAQGISKESETTDRKDDVLYETNLYIHDADYSNEGTYECFIKNNNKTAIKVIVVDPDLRCPEISEDGGLTVKYENDRRERSRAYFSCAHNSQELIGDSELTCLKTKEWSNVSPYCTGIRCRKLKETDLLTIQYKNQREVGSLATFHCFAPGVRHGVSTTICLENGLWDDPTPLCIDRCKLLEQTDSLKIHYTDDRRVNTQATFHCFAPARRTGVSFTRCLPNGTWEDPTPVCSTISCSANDLLSSLPQNAQTTMHIEKNGSFRFNSTVNLTCTNDIVAAGNPVASCGIDGKWNIDKVECVSGCRPPKKPSESKLKLSVEKKEYRFGESVTLSCPPGMILESNTQVIMCLNNGWSDKVIPNCIEDKSMEDYQRPFKLAASDQEG